MKAAIWILMLILSTTTLAMDRVERIEKCRKYYKKIAKLEDQKKYKAARHYKDKMYKLNCPTRHNRYFD